MNAVFDILNQPIFLTLLTITFGSYLLSVVADRRARKNKLRDEAIQFLQESGDHINTIFPLIYRNLRTGRIVVDQSIQDALTYLFSKRMSVQVGSEAFLQSEEFYRDYFRLLEQITAVIVSMSDYDEQVDEGHAAEIQASQALLREEWPLDNEAQTLQTFDPLEGYIAWMDMIMQRTTSLLSSNLKLVMLR